MSVDILEQFDLSEAEPATVSTANCLTASVLTDVAGLAGLADEWRILADECPFATVFQSFEWNAAWWRHYGQRPGRRLHLLAFRDPNGGRLVGLAPLMTSFWYGSPLRRLSFLGTGSSDYLDLIAAPGCEASVAAAFYDTLSRSGGWHLCDLQQLRNGGLLRAYPPDQAGKLACVEAYGEPCPYLVLPGDWETLTQQFGKKTRANIGYYDRALRKIYHVEVAAVADQDELDKEMTRLFDLHQRRWNQRWLPGVFGSRGVQQFHRDAARSLLEGGMLRLFCLRLDGVTQASLYCFAFGDRVCYYQGGFEPTLAKWSLGTVLTSHALQSSIGEGRIVFDFLRGDEPYKAKWTRENHVNARRILTRRRQANVGVLAQRVQQWEDRIERRVKAWARSRK